MYEERLRKANVACISLTASSIEMPDPSLRISTPKILDAASQEQRRPENLLEGLDEFAANRLASIRELLQTDVARAKTELGKHVSELIMHPQADIGSYVVEGEWDLLGGSFPNGQPTPRTEGLYVGMVPGGGVEPP